VTWTYSCNGRLQLLTAGYSPRTFAGMPGESPGDDGQPDLPSGGHAELPGGGQRDYLV
jgi:hypothetical protein